jgi:phage terminase large subunit
LKDLNIGHKFLPFDKEDSRYYIYTGGRGSGKSYAVAGALVYLILTPNQTILFTRYTLRSAAISIIPEFKDKLEKMEIMHLFKITKDEIINIANGSKIIFRGIKTSSGDQTANLKSLQGITTWVMDEAEELTDESIFDKIDFSVRQKGVDNRIVLILNPTTKEHWIYERFFESKGIQAGSSLTKADVTYMHSTYEDNIEHLSKSYLAQIQLMKVNRPNKYKHQILGGWLDKAEGVIFSNWKLGAFKEVSKAVFGQDFGYSNDESTLLKTSIDKNNKIIYVQECFYQTHLTTSQIAELNKKFAGDSLIVADSSEPRLINALSKDCNIVPAIKGQGSITFGISMLQDFDLVIDPQSLNLVKELNNYSWLEKKSRTPIDKFNHLIDGLRYSISYQLQNPNLGEYYIY